MKRIFFSYHFDPEIQPLVAYLKRLIASHGLEPVEGRRLGGQPLAQGVKNLISTCDAMVLFLSRREENLTNDWGKAERALAYSEGKPFISIIEQGVTNNGPFEAFEYIFYDSDNFIDPLLSISETISKWKIDLGELIEAFVEPPEVEDVIRENFDRERVVEYRFLNESTGINWTEWREATVIPKAGGVSVYLPGVKKDADIQIKVTANGRTRISNFINQNIRIPIPWE